MPVSMVSTCSGSTVKTFGHLPLFDRKQRLQRLVKGHPGLLYALHVPAKGNDLFLVICGEDLEGIVVKHKLAPYSAKPQSWFKVLNPEYSQKRGRKEMFEKFHERPRTRTQSVNVLHDARFSAFEL